MILAPCFISSDKVHRNGKTNSHPEVEAIIIRGVERLSIRFGINIGVTKGFL